MNHDDYRDEQCEWVDANHVERNPTPIITEIVHCHCLLRALERALTNLAEGSARVERILLALGRK